MQLTRFRNVENFHAFPFKFCTLNSVLKLSSANPEMAVSLFLLHWRQHKDSSCSPTASTPMQVFFVFSSGSQACAYHCCFPELRIPAHSCLDVPFPKTALPSLIVNSPLCVTPPSNPLQLQDFRGFFLCHCSTEWLCFPLLLLLRNLVAVFLIPFVTRLSPLSCLMSLLCTLLSPSSFPQCLPVLPHPGLLVKQHLLCCCKLVLNLAFLSILLVVLSPTL